MPPKRIREFDLTDGSNEVYGPEESLWETLALFPSKVFGTP